MKVGILGGSFNPPHLGHIQLCEYAKEMAGLDRILLIPTGDHPFKRRTGVSREDRLEMTKLAVENLENYDVSDIEIHREGLSYTYDTVMELKKRSGDDYYFISGSDLLFQFTWWKNFRGLAGVIDFICLPRQGVDNKGLLREAEKLNRTFDAAIQLLESQQPDDISSSIIRQKAQTGETFFQLLDPEVYAYIREHKLYQGDENEES